MISDGPLMYAADLYCGGGGTSTGMLKALNDKGYKVRLVALNHSPAAIDTHSANHTEAHHFCWPLEAVDPRQAVPGGKLDLLWASPECTHFSAARGSKPKCDQSRSAANDVVTWLEDLDVNAFAIENVQEFRTWGPLDEHGKVIPEKKGEYFLQFLNNIRNMGYEVKYRILNAADYGAPTCRKRLIIIGRKDGKELNWPEPTHSETGTFLPKWRAAHEIIDWSLPIPSIFERDRPLAEKTMQRIAKGIKKFVIDAKKPFLLSHGKDGVLIPHISKMYGTSTGSAIDEPIHTITSGGMKHALVTAFLAKHFGTSIGSDAKAPVGTLTTKNKQSIVAAHLMKYHGGANGDKRNYGLDQPIGTLDCSNRFGLVQAFLMKYYGSGTNCQSLYDPLGTVTTKERFGIVTIEHEQYAIMDICMRMLAPHELAAATGFPEDYVFKGNKATQVKLIGNAVPVELAEAVVNALI